ncbi:hypothetical protein PP744_gp093 [Rhizobium phage RHph_N38]|uniref:Uncharacterized protein n=1 Tax=Rhizobium phage RHph_N38 TaxID=2509750 RepID=A0A7S5R3N1_9CAUD|nr:hypothetical protein PP744_gp093 [Rhizobium phage RHph_N38]QIG70562.1 hypothetical protein EVB89_101 [Rhizobium phage RHph_N38]
MIEPDDKRLVFLPETDILKASGTCDALRNRWFAVHPDKGLIFWQVETRRQGQLRGAFPQCNSSKHITEDLITRMYPWAEVKFFDLVLVPININDY